MRPRCRDTIRRDFHLKWKKIENLFKEKTYIQSIFSDTIEMLKTVKVK